ncbi:MAG: site-specific integrase, partial [Spirulinaceae cyanobacterium]
MPYAGCYSEAQKLDLISSSDYTKAIGISNVKEDSRLRGRLIQREEVALLLELLEEGRSKKEPGEAQPIDIRDMALIAILRGGGLRRNEVVKLELKDFNHRTGAVEVLQGKGGKSRIVYLPEVAVELVIQWLGIRGRKSGALLCPVVKGGKIVIRHMSADAVGKTLKRLGKKAGLASFSAHDFRRTFCSELLDLGADIVTVQKLAGHA